MGWYVSVDHVIDPDVTGRNTVRGRSAWWADVGISCSPNHNIFDERFRVSRMDLETLGWTERMIVATLSDNLHEPVEANVRSTNQLFVGYWLQRHGLSQADKDEVTDACSRLEGEGLIEEVDTNGEDSGGWQLTDRGVQEVKALKAVFELAL